MTKVEKDNPPSPAVPEPAPFQKWALRTNDVIRLNSSKITFGKKTKTVNRCKYY